MNEWINNCHCEYKTLSNNLLVKTLVYLKNQAANNKSSRKLSEKLLRRKYPLCVRFEHVQPVVNKLIYTLQQNQVPQ